MTTHVTRERQKKTRQIVTAAITSYLTAARSRRILHFLWSSLTGNLFRKLLLVPSQRVWLSLHWEILLKMNPEVYAWFRNVNTGFSAYTSCPWSGAGMAVACHSFRIMNQVLWLTFENNLRLELIYFIHYCSFVINYKLCARTLTRKLVSI
jgi:hypothetical protein